MSQISFQNMRVKTCPFHKDYQQVLSYAYRAGDKIASESSGVGKDKSTIHLILAHGTRPAIKKLDHKLISSIGNNNISYLDKSLSGLGVPTKLYWPKTDNCQHFYQLCEKFGSCHTAYELVDEEIKSRTKPADSNLDAARDDYLTNAFFTMNVCIRDFPGTLYALYCIASPPSSDGETSGPLVFDFNIDYIRSTNCRVKRNVKIDFYGNFLKRAYREEFHNILSNIELIVIFYPTSKVKAHFESLKDSLKMPFKTLKPEPVEGENYLVYSRYDGPINDSTPREFSWRMRCPVARVARCPAERKRLPNEARKPPIPSNWKNERQTVKIETCIRNEAGALRELCNLICKIKTRQPNR